MKNFPFATGDADMTPLVVLVAVMPALIVHLTLFIDVHFINAGNTFAGAIGNRPLAVDR